jgi:hypothetical protein
MFQRAGIKKKGLPLPPAFQYLILMALRAWDLNFVMISSLASKFQFHFIKQLKNRHLNFKALPGCQNSGRKQYGLDLRIR